MNKSYKKCARISTKVRAERNPKSPSQTPMMHPSWKYWNSLGIIFKLVRWAIENCLDRVITFQPKPNPNVRPFDHFSTHYRSFERRLLKFPQSWRGNRFLKQSVTEKYLPTKRNSRKFPSAGSFQRLHRTGGAPGVFEDGHPQGLLPFPCFYELCALLEYQQNAGGVPWGKRDLKLRNCFIRVAKFAIQCPKSFPSIPRQAPDWVTVTLWVQLFVESVVRFGGHGLRPHARFEFVSPDSWHR